MSASRYCVSLASALGLSERFECTIDGLPTLSRAILWGNVVVRILLVALVMLYARLAVADVERDGARRLCGWNDIRQRGEYSLHNDVWGAKHGIDSDDSYIQCMSEPFGDDEVGVSFKWNFAFPSQSVKSYPHVTYGWDFSKPVQTTLLPAKVDGLKELLVEYDYMIDSAARYNTSFDIWLSDVPNPSRSDLKTELMIWVEHNALEQKRKRLASPVIGGHMYDYYAGPVSESIGHWTYTALVSHGKTRADTIDLAPYIHYIVERGALDSGAYINGISFGAELTEGSGHFQINKFRVLTIKE